MDLNITQDQFISTDVVDHLNCTICFQILIDAVVDKCKGAPHSFCRSCISEWLTQRQVCPTSHENLTIAMLEDDVSKRKELDSLIMKCSNHLRKCDWIGKLADYAAHFVICPKRLYFAKTLTVEAKEKSQSEFADSLPNEVALQDTLELDSIILGFSAQITALPLLIDYYGLCSIQLVWRHKSDPVKDFVYGKSMTSWSHELTPTSVDRREVFRLNPGQSLEQILLYKSEFGFSVVGFKIRGKEEARLFGYIDRKGEKDPVMLEISEQASVVGLFGSTNWGISKLGFQVLISCDL